VEGRERERGYGYRRGYGVPTCEKINRSEAEVEVEEGFVFVAPKGR
jgi:hypothetical protein